MDEIVLVKFPQDRDVIVNGNHTAKTNEKFILQTGTHRFSLGGPPDFQPESQVHAVEGTTVDDPLVVTFTPLAQPVGGQV